MVIPASNIPELSKHILVDMLMLPGSFYHNGIPPGCNKHAIGLCLGYLRRLFGIMCLTRMPPVKLKMTTLSQYCRLNINSMQALIDVKLRERYVGHIYS